MFAAPLPHTPAETASARKAFALSMQTSHLVCSPPAQKAVPVLGGSGAASVGITTRKPNFDLTGTKLVKRGVLVSWGGCRFKVVRVVAGRAYYGEAFSNSVACGLVQVVA